MSLPTTPDDPAGGTPDVGAAPVPDPRDDDLAPVLPPGAHADRRVTSDRRRAPTPALSRHSFAGRRHAARRAGEHRDRYVDRYRPLEWGLVLGIVALSLLDMVLTLDYVARGGVEANPLMHAAIEAGERTFVLVKLGVTMCGALFLLIHVRFRRVVGLLALVFGLYVLLTGYHVFLRSHLPPDGFVGGGDGVLADR